MEKYSQKQIRSFVIRGAATCINNYNFEQLEQLRNENNLERVAISVGIYGLNGGLLQDITTGKLYAITARNEALNYFF